MAEVAKSLPNLDLEVLGKQKSLASEETRLFPSVTPTGCEQVTEGHDAERARKSIMPRSAATQGAVP